MFSFRKIINILVLISYVKMTIVSSFAMDPVQTTTPSIATLKANINELDTKITTELTELKNRLDSDRQIISDMLAKYPKTDIPAPVHSAITTKLKVIPTFYEDGELDHVSLQLVEKDILSKTKTVLDSKTVYNPNYRHNLTPLPSDFMNWLGNDNSIDGFKWDLKGYGLVKIDFKGSVILDGAQQLDPQRAFKISTVSPILLQNCTYHHLRTKSKLVMLMGGNTLHNLTAQITDIGGGVLIYKQGQADTLGHISLSQGSLVNVATPTIMDGAVWDIGGGTFSNQDQLNLQGKHHVLNANLVQNDASITGGDLTLDAKDIINSSDLDLKSLKATTAGSFVNTKKIQTQTGLDLNIHADGVNSGTLSSKGTISIESRGSAFVNDGEIDGDTVTANNINNNGDIKSVRGMTLANGENHGTIHDLRRGIHFIGEFLNLSSISAPSVYGTGMLKSKGLTSTQRIAVRSFQELGGSLFGNFIFVTTSCAEFLTSTKTLIDTDELIIERNSDSTTRTLAGTVKATVLETSSDITIDGSVDVHTLKASDNSRENNFNPTRVNIHVGTSGKLKSEKTFLNNTAFRSQGNTNLGFVWLNCSYIENAGNMFLIPVGLSACRDKAISNSGIIQTTFSHPKIKPYSSWAFSRALNNEGTLHIQGEYTPAYPLDDRPHIDTWNGKVIVEDTLLLLASTELMNPALFSNFTVNRLVIDGQGGDYSGLSGSQDWTFAQHNVFQNFRQLWFFRTALRVNNPHFMNIGSLISDGNMHVATGDLITRNIGQFRMGSANDHLGKVYIADGGADMEVDGPADIRYGQIEMKKDGRICSLNGNVLVGEEGGKEDTKVQMYSHPLHTPTYTKKYLNGSHVKSHGKLKLEAPEADILINYGQVLSAKGLELISKNLVKNLSGVVVSYGDIILRTKKYLQTRPDLLYFNASIAAEWHDQQYYLEQSDPANLTAMGSLFLFLDQFENQYGDVLVGKSLFINNDEISLNKIPTSLMNTSRLTYFKQIHSYKIGKRRKRRWVDEKQTKYLTPTIATIRVGEEMLMNGGVIKSTGAIDASKVSLNINEFLAQSIGSKFQIPDLGVFEFDITKIMEGAKDDPMAAQFNLGTSCLTDGQETPITDDATDPLQGLNPDYIVYKIFSQVAGKAYLKITDGKTVSGDELLKFLAKNGRALAQGLKSQLSALVWEYQQVKDRLERHLKLFISPDDVNPYQGSGDVTGNKIHIKTTGDQTHIGNTVHADTKTVLESESDFTGQSAQISGDDGVGVKAKNLRAETLAQRIYTNNGFYDVVGKEMQLTSKYGPALLISFADMILNGTLVSGSSTGLNIGGNRHIGTTELHSEQTDKNKKRTRVTERTTHHRTHLNAHGRTRPKAEASSSAPSAQASSSRSQDQAQPKSPFNPNRTVHDGVTLEDVDPAEYEQPRKPYHQNPEWLRTTEPYGYTWDEAAYKAVPELRSSMKNPRRAKLNRHQQKTVTFDLDDDEDESDDDFFGDAPAAGKLDIETEGSSVDIGRIATATVEIRDHTKGTAFEAPAMNTHSFTDTKKSRHGFGGKKTKTLKTVKGTAQVCTATAGEKITKEGDAELTLMGSQMQAKVIHLKSREGRINLLTALGYTFHSVEKKSKDAAWQSMSQSAEYNEDRQYCSFKTDTEEGLLIEAANGVRVEFIVEKYSDINADRSKPKTKERSRLKDLPTEHGYEWLQTIDKRDDFIRVYVDERHDTSYMRQEGLSAAARIVLNIALNFITGGSGGILSNLFNNFIINTISARGDISRGASQTFSKDGLKSVGRAFVIKTLIGDFKGAEGSSALVDLQNAFMETLHNSVGDYLGRGIIDRDWRVDARRIGLDLATSTVAKFGAKRIGNWRSGTIKGENNTFLNDVLHKALHGGLAAAGAAAEARISHIKGAERKKRILGAAGGAIVSEIVSESMMSSAMRRMETQLLASGHAPNSKAYTDLRQSLLKEEFLKIKTVAQLAVVAAAESMKFDLNSAMFAANNALENNSAQVFLQLFAFKEAEDVQAEAPGKLKRSGSAENLRQLDEIQLAEEIEDEFRDHALNHGSIWDKVLYWGSFAVDSIDGTGASSVLRARHGMRRAVKDAPKVVQDGAEILYDLASGRSVDDSRLDAYSELINNWGPNATGFLAGFVGSRGIKGGTGRGINRNVNRQHFQDHHIISNKHPLTKDHQLWRFAGMDPNDRANRMFLPTVEGARISTTTRSIHQGKHDGRVNVRLAQKMDTARERGRLNSWTQMQYAEQLRKILSDERQILKSGERSLNKNKRSWADN